MNGPNKLDQDRYKQAMSAIGKACVDISNSIKCRLVKRREPATAATPKDEAAVQSTSPSSLVRDGLSAIRMKTSRSARRARYMQAHARRRSALCADGIFTDDRFLRELFGHFSARELCCLTSVCKKWRDILYQEKWWTGCMIVVDSKEWSDDDISRRKFYQSLQNRAIEWICLNGSRDADIERFTTEIAGYRKNIRALTVRNSSINDSGLEALLERLPSVCRLELISCNDLTESGLWSALTAKIVSMTISDCINIADDSVNAVGQLLPSLHELNLQAYHVTDACLALFSAKQSYSLGILRLNSCWEITDHGLVTAAQCLPNLHTLSLSGCSKITDAGIEVVAETMKKLTNLDLSWCPKISDAATESIACDLLLLENINLDRCKRITDVGVGYLSTINELRRLSVRWCSQLTDEGLRHLYAAPKLQTLALAGCNQITAHAVLGLRQLPVLEELELTNCACARDDVITVLRSQMPNTSIIV